MVPSIGDAVPQDNSRQRGCSKGSHINLRFNNFILSVLSFGQPPVKSSARFNLPTIYYLMQDTMITTRWRKIIRSQYSFSSLKNQQFISSRLNNAVCCGISQDGEEQSQTRFQIFRSWKAQTSAVAAFSPAEIGFRMLLFEGSNGVMAFQNVEVQTGLPAHPCHSLSSLRSLFALNWKLIPPFFMYLTPNIVLPVAQMLFLLLTKKSDKENRTPFPHPICSVYICLTDRKYKNRRAWRNHDMFR